MVKMNVKHISDKLLVARIQKGLLLLNNKKDNPINKHAKNLDISLKNIHKWPMS